MTPKRSSEELSQPSYKLSTKRGLATEMEKAFGQENIPSPPRSSASRNEILRSTLTAQQTFNAALARAGERLERGAVTVLQLEGRECGSERDQPQRQPAFRDIRQLEREVTPAKAVRRSVEESSPLRGIRRTLGEITPSKNCKADNTANLDLDLPFSWELGGVVGGLPCPALPTTPLPAEKCAAPVGLGSPALKLKKRFAERFQEELQEQSELARPLAWLQEEELLATPSRHRNTGSPTLLVAAALVQLHESPTRHEDLPLNLTKKSNIH